MCEVNASNFRTKFAEISESLISAKFIGLDFEFSALYPLKTQQPSLFDTPSERYRKIRKNVEQVIPVQIGLTAFIYDQKRNAYKGRVFTFYVIPASFQNVDRSFYFRSDTIGFLKMYDFDFNKFAYSGIPFLNTHAEAELRQRFTEGTVSEKQASCISVIENILSEEGDTIKKWFSTAKPGDKLTIPSVTAKCKNNKEVLYFVHKNLRRRFRNLWTSTENGEFTVKVVDDDQYEDLSSKNNLESDTLEDLLGFTKVFRLLVTLQKPIIGHNLFQDIVLMVNSFEQPLPQSYQEFKKLCVNLFPVIFDTKVLVYELKDLIPEEKRWTDTGLNSLFDYFKNGIGRHLAHNSPAIEIENDQDNYGQFHEAGWDSFCTGYIFIRIAHLNICRDFPVSKTFVPNELIGRLSHLKNYLNVIRGSTSSIKLDGEDPKSTRPPFLVVESIKNKPIDIVQVSSVLSEFGFVEVRKLPMHTRKALVAVDNFGNARRILSNLHKVNKDFQVNQYSALKHSPVVRALLLSGITISSAVLFWLSRSIKK